MAVLIPYPLYTEVWDYDLPVPPPCPAPFDEAAYGRVLAHLMDRRRRVGIYAGLGCVDAGRCAGGRRRAAAGAGGHFGQRQGLHPRRPPAGRRLGLRQAGHPRRRGGLQGRRPGAGRRRPLQRGLDGLLRHSAPRHADPRRRQSPEPGAQRAGPRHVCARMPAFSSTGCWSTATPIRRARLP